MFVPRYLIYTISLFSKFEPGSLQRLVSKPIADLIFGLAPQKAQSFALKGFVGIDFGGCKDDIEIRYTS